MMFLRCLYWTFNNYLVSGGGGGDKAIIGFAFIYLAPGSYQLKSKNSLAQEVWGDVRGHTFMTWAQEV